MTIYEKCLQAGDTSIHDNYTYICQNSCGIIEFPLTGKQIKRICTLGDNEVPDDERICEWMKKYSDEQIRDALAEFGDWSSNNLSDRKTNISRLIRALAWELFESENPNESLAVDELQNA